MINKLTSSIILFLISLFVNSFVIANEEFNFNISEINILENGNKIIGSKRGDVTTNDGIVISADNFVFNKVENILTTNGNVVVYDKINDYKIISEKIIYNIDSTTYKDPIRESTYFARYESIKKKRGNFAKIRWYSRYYRRDPVFFRLVR